MKSSGGHSFFPDVKTEAGRRRSLKFASGGALVLALLYALRVVVLLTAPESARIEITISVTFCALGFAFATLIRRNTFVRCARSILLVWALAELVLRFLNGQCGTLNGATVSIYQTYWTATTNTTRYIGWAKADSEPAFRYSIDVPSSVT